MTDPEIHNAGHIVHTPPLGETGVYITEDLAQGSMYITDGLAGGVQTVPVAQTLEYVQNLLGFVQKRIGREIAEYPTPISGCDAQFNHLLAARERVHAALLGLGSEPFVATPRTPEPGAKVESR